MPQLLGRRLPRRDLRPGELIVSGDIAQGDGVLSVKVSAPIVRIPTAGLEAGEMSAALRGVLVMRAGKTLGRGS